MKPETFKIKINIIAEVEMSEVAKQLAEKHNDNQAEFLNEFSEALIAGCESVANYQMQLAYIIDKLDEQGKMLILDLAEFIKIQEDEDNR